MNRGEDRAAKTMFQRGRKKKAWWGEVWVLILVFALPGIVLFPYSQFRMRTSFQASLTARSVAFRVGDAATPLFTETPVDLTVEGSAAVTHRNATLRALDLPAGSLVRVEWFRQSPDGVRLFVDRGEKGKGDMGSVQVEHRVVPLAGENGRLALSLDPVKPKTLQPEMKIPIQDRTAIEFADKQGSAIAGFDGTVQLREVDRKATFLQGEAVEIGDLTGTQIAELRVEKDGLHVQIAGEAGVLKVRGEDLRHSLVEYLVARKNWGAYFSTVTLVGTTLLAILSRLKLVKLEGR